MNRLRHELELRGGPSNHIGGPSHNQASHQQPPNIGNGQGTLFGGIMANPSGPAGPGLAPPSQDQQQGPGPHQIPQSQSGPQPPQQPPFGGYPQQPVNGKPPWNCYAFPVHAVRSLLSD